MMEMETVGNDAPANGNNRRLVIDNAYATSKSVSQSELNISNIVYQIGLVVAMFATRDNSIGLAGFEITLLVFVSLSWTLEFIMFVLLVLLAKTDTENVTRHCTAVSVNSWITTLSAFVLVANSVITVLEVETTRSRVHALTQRLANSACK